MKTPVTVHVILNAHLDPVWLWPWTAGIDSAIATCRSVCDLLDRHPDLFFNRGEAWVYDVVERIDPVLFERMRSHIESGRWHVVGGWWIQPDCNLPSGFALRRQIALGQSYFRDRFGVFPREAFNVDSFGHAASLPTLMQQHGQDRYVFMRPREFEKDLPGRVFRWSQTAESAAVTAFRVPSGYRTVKHDDANLRQHVLGSLEGLPPGIDHTMTFMGVGDHGGGPTETLVAWVRENRDAFPGATLEFSTVTRFFDAVDSACDAGATLPAVAGELQYHAVGCYSATRRIKSELRRAEHLTLQAQTVTSFGEAEAAWRDVCFHQFHDTLGGTCTESAYVAVYDQLGRACADSDERIAVVLRQKMQSLEDDTRQRLVWLNASDQRFEDWVEVEPWLEFQAWDPCWRLVDRRGRRVDYQRVDAESRGVSLTRLLLPLSLDTGELCEVMLDESADGPAASEPSGWDCTAIGASGPRGAGPAFEAAAGDRPHRVVIGGRGLDLSLGVIEDVTDTWSHGVDRYGEATRSTATWRPAAIHDHGPLMVSVIQHGEIEGSRLETEMRLYREADFVELRLRVDWTAERGVLKLTVSGSEDARFSDRVDGVMGTGPHAAGLGRPMSGAEVPIQDFTRWTVAGTEATDAGAIGVVCPDVYALDGTDDRVRLTLLRSAWFGDHEIKDRESWPPRRRTTDRGTHTFLFRFYGGERASDERLSSVATMLQRPPAFADLTRGMKHWPREVVR